MYITIEVSQECCETPWCPRRRIPNAGNGLCRECNRERTEYKPNNLIRRKEKWLCMTPHCRGKSKSNLRGLCVNCYNKYLKEIFFCKTTWAILETEGFCDIKK